MQFDGQLTCNLNPWYGFYKSRGVEQRKIAKLMGKEKQLKRDGALSENRFVDTLKY